MESEHTQIDAPSPEYNIRWKPVTTAPKTPNEPQGRDTFETPNYAVDLLIPFIPKNINFIWEPAVGNGKIKSYFTRKGFEVFGSDIRQSDSVDQIHNFISGGFSFGVERSKRMAIITNPPYSIKEKFIERAFEYGVPFAFLINADYSGQQIDWIKRGCQKLIPQRRIDFITPTGRNGSTSSSQFHSMWLCYKFNLEGTETFVDLSLKDKKENI